jgi:hypothetical protein
VKRISKKELIIQIGLLLSLIGAISVLIWGIRGFIAEPIEYKIGGYYFAIYFSVFALIGTVVGFFKEKAGIIIIMITGTFGLILTLLLTIGSLNLWLVISVILVLIGGIIGMVGYFKKE